MAPSKRKRAPTLTSHNPSIEVAQPSSRDASDEGVEDPVLQEVSSLKHKQSATSDPPSKRTRSNTSENGADESEDSSDEVSGSRPKSRSAKRGTRTSISKTEQEKIDDIIEHGEGGERGTMGMEAPPKAGLVDPVGYKTNPPPTGRPVRIYADGVFDLFHLGHMRQLQQAKTAFPDVWLMVGVTGDKETHRRKGLTVLSGKERAESVRHCKWVDEVIEDCPWIIADATEFIEKHKIDYIAHDDIPYGADEGDDIYAPIKAAGKFLVTQRTEGVSTTGIITKIVKDYDKYISRQLKRGTSRQELNVSWLKKNELELKRNMAELRDSIRHNWTTTGQELGKELRQFWQPSRPASPARTPTHERLEPDLNISPKFSGLTSPSALAHLSHLEVPSTSNITRSSDFAAGYSLGLIGGVRSWMARSRRNLNDSRPDSPTSSGDSSDEKSPNEQSRGRRGKQVRDDANFQDADEASVKS
ncbi:Nucleotidylyl transferase [Patellaria atrata CBS 101060]|uniref:choline-phosphate cytidylyltransferase n=1 Tax=Patellaria atrata CBS 101060 TaxID=1346257 RepID=A0A9P4VRC5_9PEZI|nr:Nucleotidylyl transferase [Patellaria atrata CBS 101060]